MSKLSPGDAFPHFTVESADGPVQLHERWQARPLVVAFMRHFG